MGNEQKNYSPQLVMFREDLTGLPPVEVPEGYTVRSMYPGEEKAWEEIIKESFQWEGNFQRDMASHDIFKPERVWYVCYNDAPVATATAWYNGNWKEDTGYLHMVGILKAHAGKGLGLQVSLAAMHYMVKEGRKSAVLQTDDFRIPAIKTYLKLGYKPQMVHENQIQRWKDIYTRIDRKELISQLPEDYIK